MKPLSFLTFAAAASALILQSTVGLAAPNVWRAVGPSPPAVSAAIAAHAPSHTIYIGSNGGGVFKSRDGGATFFPVNKGLDNPFVTAMVMDPNNPNVVYAGGFKTTNGGASWTAQDSGDGFSMAIDPTNPSVVYAGFLGIDKTIDGGVTWESASEGLGTAAVYSVAINPFSPSVVFAGTAGDGAFRSVDGGAHWKPLKIDSTVWGLLVDPDDGDIVYAGTNGKGVYRSIDGGNTFRYIGSPNVHVIVSLAKSGHELYAGTGGGGVSVSEDGGVTWSNTGVSQSQGLALSVDSAGAVYLGTSSDGAFMHPARGAGWRRLASKRLSSCDCESGHALAIDPSDHDHVFLTTNDSGLLVTEDGGRTWSDGGIHGISVRAPRSLAFDPQRPALVYASSIAGGIFKSSDHGKHWQRRRFGIGTNYTTALSVDPVDHSLYVGTIANLGIAGIGIWKSTDLGETFKRIDRAPNAAPGEYLNLSGRGIAVDPKRHAVVYFADRVTGIWRSRNAGATWVNVDPNGVLSVTIDPSDSNIVYAGAVGGLGVLRSIDGGLHFTVKSVGLPEDINTARTGAVLVDPAHPNILFVATEGAGVFESTDGAESWFPINSGLDDLDVFGLAMAPDQPNILYASTGSSVHRLTITP